LLITNPKPLLKILESDSKIFYVSIKLKTNKKYYSKKMYSLSGNKQDDHRLHNFFKNLIFCLIKYTFFLYRNFGKYNDLTKADVIF